MKKIYPAIALILLSALIIPLVGCGGGDLHSNKDKLRVLVENERFQAAEKIYLKYIYDNPTDSTLLYQGCLLYWGMDMPDSALVLINKFTSLYPIRRDGFVWLRKVAAEVQDYDREIYAVSQIADMDGDRRSYLYDIANLNFLRGETGLAISTCNHILEYDPGNQQVMFLLANSLAKAGVIDSAIVVMKRLNSMAPKRIDVLANLGSFHATAGKYYEAGIYYDSLTIFYPDYIPGWFGLGNVKLQLGDTTGALAAYYTVYQADQTFLGVDSIIRSIDPMGP